MPYKNLERKRENWRQWYRRNREARLAVILTERTKLRQRNIQIVLDYKTSHSCPCGENHSACLEFHHRDGDQKEAAISFGVYRPWGVSKLLREMRKCDVLCSNCHRNLHWRLRLQFLQRSDCNLPDMVPDFG